MDAVGSAAAVIELVKTAFAIIKFIKDAKGSAKQRDHLWQSIEQVKTDLEWVDERCADIQAGQYYPPSFKKLLVRDDEGNWQRGPFLDHVNQVFVNLTNKIQVSVDDISEGAWRGQRIKFRQLRKAVEWPIIEKSVRAAIGDLDRLNSQIGSAIQRAQLEQAISTGRDVEDIKRDVTSLKQSNADDVVLKVLEWISPDELYNPLQHVPLEERIPADWIMNNEAFMSWMEGRPWRLMLYGYPGRGKTMLSGLIADSLRSLPSEASHVVLSLFLKYEDQDRQTLDRLLALLLKQFLATRSKDFPPDVVDLWREKRATGSRLSGTEIADILCEQISCSGLMRISIIVDGLDEAAVTPVDTRLELIDQLTTLKTRLREESCGLNLLFTSRPLEHVPPATLIQCDSCKRLDLKIYYMCRAHVKHADDFHMCQTCAGLDEYIECDLCEPYISVDIDLEPPNELISDYVGRLLSRAKAVGTNGELGGLSSVGQFTNRSAVGTTTIGRTLERLHDPDLEQEIIESITENAHGSFLLAKAQWDHIKTASRRAEIEDALEFMPKDVNSTYERALERIKSEKESIASKGLDLIMWLTYSRRVMTYHELEHALTVRTSEFLNPRLGMPPARRSRRIFDKDDLVDMNTYLAATAGLVQKSEGGTLRLMHRTAYDFFEDEEVRKKHFSGRGHRQIAITCMAYLLHTDAKKLCVGDDEEHQLVRQLDSLPFAVYASQHWGAHASAAQADEDMKKLSLQILRDQSLLAATMQASSFCEYDQPSGWKMRKGASRMHVAAWFGLHTAIQELVRAGEPVDLFDDTGYGWTPLIYACRNGNATTVRYLLKISADVNRRDNYNHHSPLRHAIQQGHTDVIRVLCEQPGIDINRLEQDDQTCLMLATETSTSEIIDLIARTPGINLNATNTTGASALTFATRRESPHAAEVLLQAPGIDVNLLNKQGMTALAWAARDGRFECVQRFLQEGADTEIRDTKNGCTPLMWAVMQGHRRIVEEFHKHSPILPGSNTNNHGWTLLHGAASYNRAEIAQWLLEHGAVIDAIDKKGRTPLHLAADAGFTRTAQVLIDAGANTKLQETDTNDTAADVAEKEGFLELARLIDAATLSPTQRTEDKLTACVLAKRGMVDALAKRLSLRPSDIYTVDSAGNTPLHCAVDYGKLECAQAILAADPKIDVNIGDIRNNQGRSPLWLACKTAYPTLVKLLLSHVPGPDVGTMDNDKYPALGASLLEEDYESAVALVGAGASLARQKVLAQDLMLTAVEEGDVRAVERLLAHGMRTTYHERVLAEQLGHGELVRLLRRHRTIDVGAAKVELGVPCKVEGVVVDSPLQEVFGDISQESRRGSESTLLPEDGDGAE